MKYHAVNNNREGRMDLGDQRTDGNLSDDVNPNLLNNGRRLTSDKSFLETRKIGIWNLKTLFQAGNLENVIMEMEHMKIDTGIFGICETRWTENGRINKEDHLMIYSDGQQHANGVGIIFTKAVAESIKSYWQISDRILLIKLLAAPFNIAIIQVCASTSSYSDEYTEQWYEGVKEAMKVVKSDEYIIIMGDLNAKVIIDLIISLTSMD